MIINAAELRNFDVEDKIQKVVEYNMKCAKDNAMKGFAYCCLSTDAPGITLGTEYSVIIMRRLEKYGYRQWTQPVYRGGVQQRSMFFTWRTDA